MTYERAKLNHSVTDAEPENGTYCIQYDNESYFDYEIAHSKTESFEIAEGIIMDGYCVSDIYLVMDDNYYCRRDYEQEMRELAYSEQEELVEDKTQTDVQLELVETNGVFIIFANNKQTPFMLTFNPNAKLFYGSELISNDFSAKTIEMIKDCTANQISPIVNKPETKATPEVVETEPESCKKMLYAKIIEIEEPPPSKSVIAALLQVKKASKKRLVGLPQYFKQYEDYILQCLNCFDSYTKKQHTEIICSWKIKLNGYNAIAYLSESLDWSIESKTPDEFPVECDEFFADNDIERP